MSKAFSSTRGGRTRDVPYRSSSKQGLFFVKMEETQDFIVVGCICIGNGTMAFPRWSPAATKIPNGAVLGSRWMRMWRLPLPAWSEEYFREIGSRCGGLLEVDPRFVNRELISAVRRRWERKNLLDIPRMLELRFNRGFCTIGGGGGSPWGLDSDWRSQWRQDSTVPSRVRWAG